MTQENLTLASIFPAATRAEWEEVAAKSLKGKPLEKLTSKTDDGLALPPLFTSADLPAAAANSGVPGAAPFTRGAGLRGAEDTPWDVRVPLTVGNAKSANAQALEDLNGGATSLHLVLDRAARCGRDNGNDMGEGGVAVHSLMDLSHVLEGVYTDLAPLSIEAGGAFASAAALVMAHWAKAEIDGSTVKGFFNADPVGALLADGELPGTMDEANTALVALTKKVLTTYPRSRTITVNGALWAGAGASEGQELAITLATAIHYLRVLEAAGIPLDDAAGQIQFRLSASPDVFLTIAKIRAMRRLWAEVLSACGVEAQGAMIWADGATRTTTRRDPYVNMLRGTAATFAAAVAGADAISVRAFDEAVGEPSDLARRNARNTQMILAEESNLGRVADPAGGSFLFEKLTDDLANAAWTKLQEIESSGGILAAITDGWLQTRVGETATKRLADVARRKVPLTGVSEFPLVGETLPETRPAEKISITTAEGKEPASSDFDDLMEAAKEGAPLAALTAAFYKSKPQEMAALKAAPLASDFDRLRDLSDMAVMLNRPRPSIFLANLGPVARHTARATFAKNFFEAGGIEAKGNEGFDSPDAMAEAFKASGTSLAVLCGADGQYEELVASFAPALKAAGAKQLYLAGAPGIHADDYTKAGVDGFIAMGSDLVSTLEDAFRILEVEG